MTSCLTSNFPSVFPTIINHINPLSPQAALIQGKGRGVPLGQPLEGNRVKSVVIFVSDMDQSCIWWQELIQVCMENEIREIKGDNVKKLNFFILYTLCMICV